MSSSSERIAVVTGASDGFGEAISRRLSENNWTVAMLARGEEKLRVAAADFGGCPYVCDITDHEQVREVAADVTATYGKVNALINNAGRGLGKPYHEASPAEILALYEVNTFGALGCIFAFEAGLVEASQTNSADIINIVSAAATSAYPKGAIYAGSKAGLLHTIRGLVPYYEQRGINVHAVLPGFSDTEGFPQDSLPWLAKMAMSTTPKKVAKATVERIGKKSGEVHVPHRMFAAAVASTFMPATSSRVANKLLGDYHPRT